MLPRRNLLLPPWPCGQYLLRALSLILIWPTGGLTQSAGPKTNDVCPEALWKKSFFLRGPSTDAAFSNVTHWDYEQARTYYQNNVLQQVMPNLVFTLIAIAALVIFVLWRILRQCCLCCQKSECDERRSKADPEKLLAGVGYWLIMGPLYVLGVASLGAMIAGLILTPRHLLTDLHSPVRRLSDHLNATALSMDRLAEGLGDVEPILGNISALANNDVNFANLSANVDTLAKTLDLSSARPNTTLATLNNIDTSLAGIRTLISDSRSQMGSAGLGPNMTALSNGLPYWEVVHAPSGLFVNYSVALTDLNTELKNLNNASGPVYPTAATLSAALTAVPIATWRNVTAALLGALDAWGTLRKNSGLSNLAEALKGLQTGMQTLANVTLPNAAQQVNTFAATWSAAAPALNSLLDRMDYIQSNVALLDPSTSSTLTSLRAVSQSLGTLTALPIANLTANLTSLAADLQMGPVEALMANLRVAQSRLGDLSSSVLESARSAVQAVSYALEALQPKYDATVAAFNSYKANVNAATFSTLKSSAVASGATWDMARAAQSATTSAANNVSVNLVGTTVVMGNMTSLVTDAVNNMSAVDATLAITADCMTQRVPGLTPYEDIVANMASLYDNLPTPPSAVLSQLLQTLNSWRSYLVTVPAEVRTSVADAADTVTSGADTLRNKVVRKIDKVDSKSTRPVSKVDDLRHHVSIALFSVGAFLSVLLLLFAVLHCPWGLGFSIFFSLVLAALLFAVSVVFASALVFVQDGCEHVESVAVNEMGSSSNLKPLLMYYFYGTDNSSIRAALKSADMVDVDEVTMSILDTSESIVANLSATYKPQAKLQSIFNSILAVSNSTMTSVNIVLDNASLPQIRPLYHDLKNLPCCTLGNYMIKTWMVMTCAGWLLLTAANLAISQMGLLDKLLPPNYDPNKSCSAACMGCVSMTPWSMKKLKDRRNMTMSKVQAAGSASAEAAQATEQRSLEQKPVSAIVLQPPVQESAPARAGPMQPTAASYPMGAPSGQSMMMHQPMVWEHLRPYGSAPGVMPGGPSGSGMGLMAGAAYGSVPVMMPGGPSGSGMGSMAHGAYGSVPGVMPGRPSGSVPMVIA